MTRWAVVGGGTAGCVVAANLAAGLPDDEVVLFEAGPVHPPCDAALPDDPGRRWPEPYPQGFGLGGGSLVNAGVVVSPAGAYRHRVPLEPPGRVGALGRAVLAADADAATVLLARRAGRRVTVADAYLADLPPNLAVRTGAEVRRVAFDGRRAVGVATAAGEHVAGDRVVLCAGALHTPELLLRSGVTDISGVGEGLQDHLGVTITMPLADGVVEADAALIGVTVERADGQIVVFEPGALLAGYLTPVATGSVTVPDPDGPAEITFGAPTDSDRDGLRAVVRRALALAQRPEVRALCDGEPAVVDAPSPYFHAAGSCRGGETTDDLGWVWFYEGLAVCDASLLPGVPRANPYLAVIDLAERLSSEWVAQARLGR